MKYAGVGLQLYLQRLPRLRLPGKQHFPVVHVDSLNRLAVHKQQKLGIFRIVALVNLSADLHPHALPRQFLRHRIRRLKPVMTVLAVPVHRPAVKLLPCFRRISAI